MLLKQLPARKNGLQGLCFWYKDQDRKIVLIRYAKKSAKQYNVGINKVMDLAIWEDYWS
ncbi:hypothetical protein HanPSC8_Chr05g0219351 [Helianthus annuus]|nr:hypothetical protein HanPSC8_Chr05g0219351 [Helianthus annuus]